MPSETKYQMIDNYIYLYHTDTLIIVPSYSADSISDTMQVGFTSSQPLSRSAPIYSYTGSGPRSLQVSFKLHRDMMNQINLQNTKTILKNELDGDYVDRMIKEVQAAALPSYAASKKMVDPPIVAVRLGDEIFIKGVVSGGVTVSYELPLLAPKYEGGPSRYANVAIGFTINEIDPYDAYDAIKFGSFRGLSTTLERRIYGAK